MIKTGIYIRAKVDGRFVSEDIAKLPAQAVRDWLETKDKSYIINTVMLLLNLGDD